MRCSVALLATLLAMTAGCDRAVAEDRPRGGARRDTEPRLDTAHESRNVASLPREELLDQDRGALRTDAFLGIDDAPRRRSLANASVARVEKGRGGRSLAFKIRLVDGTVGYYKPEQTFSGAHWYAEIAAYYLDRALGFGRVPPVVSRQFRWAKLAKVAGDDPRVPEIIVQDDGTVRGAFIGWIDGPLPPLRLRAGWERWVRIDGPLATTPYQPTRDYWHPRSTSAAPQTAPTAAMNDARAAELSDMIVFDYLTANVDRWGGDFTNVRTVGRGPLIFLDNGAAFWPGQQRLAIIEARLDAVQRFRAQTVRAIEALDLTKLGERLAADPLAPILSARQLEGIALRRRVVLEHVAEMRRRFGNAAVPW